MLTLVGPAPAAALPSPVCPATNATELTAALVAPGCTTINLAAGSYAANPGAGNPAFIATHNVTIHGAGAATTSLARSASTGPVFSVGTSAVSLDNVTLRDATGGAGVTLPNTTSQVTLDHVVVDNNSGGGINSASNSSSAVTVTDSVISNNSSAEGGGVFANGTGTLNFNGVLLSGNSSTEEADGGGAFSSRVPAPPTSPTSPSAEITPREAVGRC